MDGEFSGNFDAGSGGRRSRCWLVISNAAKARFLALIAELDRRRGWAEWGVKTCAHWLNRKCGFNLGAAREKVRVAHALDSCNAQIGVGRDRDCRSFERERRLSYLRKCVSCTGVADAPNDGKSAT